MERARRQLGEFGLSRVERALLERNGEIGLITKPPVK
jgi:uncharacterized membrane protein YcaP (DUF421 family)